MNCQAHNTLEINAPNLRLNNVRYGDELTFVRTRAKESSQEQPKARISNRATIDKINGIVGIETIPGGRRRHSKVTRNITIPTTLARNDEGLARMNVGSFSTFRSRYQTRESSAVVLAANKQNLRSANRLSLNGSRVTRDWVL
jgi:hypothetical protein